MLAWEDSFLNSLLLHLGRFLGRHLRQFVQLLSSHRSHVSEEKNERELNPLLRHHEQALDEQPFQYLWRDAFEEAKRTFVMDDIFHHLEERFEWLALPGWWRPGLQADFGDDERL